MVMSDRIGVMRAGRLVQVGTPEDIYTRPSDRFVSEFMGDVNVIAVRPNGNGTFEGVDVPGHFRAPVAAREAGYIVIRPEFLRFVATSAEADNAVAGVVYNEYSLGSRMQYQVRVGDKVFVVERSRREAWSGGLDRSVLVGWDAGDAIFVPG
jgi:spermidine/putrescine transport system ATP-binding protein